MIFTLNLFFFSNQDHSSAILNKTISFHVCCVIASDEGLLPIYDSFPYFHPWIWCHRSRGPWSSAWCLSVLFWVTAEPNRIPWFSPPLLLKGTCWAWHYLSSFFVLSVIPVMELYNTLWHNKILGLFAHFWHVLWDGPASTIFVFIRHSPSWSSLSS